MLFRSDGRFQDAEFFRPQGTVLVNGILYVADTENHLIRAVNLAEGTVSTLAGTGVQGQPGQPLDGGLLQVSLNSPWSIAHVKGSLFIAMAGPHQIWSHVLGSDRLAVHAGSGREDVVNGTLAEAAFAHLGTVGDRARIFHGTGSYLPEPWFAAQAAAAGVPLHSVPGGHFFLQEDDDRAAALVREALG